MNRDQQTTKKPSTENEEMVKRILAVARLLAKGRRRKKHSKKNL